MNILDKKIKKWHILNNKNKQNNKNINLIINELNKFELSYENIIHNKVQNIGKYNLYLAIPKGIKCFIFYKNFSNINYVYIIEVNSYKRVILNIQEYKLVNNNSKNDNSENNNINNTLFYGTFFNHLNNKLFSIEDIFLSKGSDISNLVWGRKIKIILNLLKNDLNNNINNYFYNNSNKSNFEIFYGLPICSTNLNEFNEYIENKNKYNIYNFQFLDFNKSKYKVCININNYLNKENIKTTSFENSNDLEEKEKNIENKENKKSIIIEDKKIKKKNILQNTKIFALKADIQNDIYYIFNNNSNNIDNYKDNEFEIAFIPDYKTSKMMNTLFRNIKENNDLDKLEDSDDEEEFQNSDPYKFVDVNKILNMECVYNKKFRKWVPLREIRI